MSACNLPVEIVDSGIQIKTLLKKAYFEKESNIIDTFLCQYEYVNLYDKQELITSVLDIFEFDSNRLRKVSVSTDLSEAIPDFCESLRGIMRDLQAEMAKIPFEKFVYNGKEYAFKRDVFNFIINQKGIVVLLKENGEYFDDNLLAIDFSGKVLWGSWECIDCKDRRGACFVGLRELSGDDICANAYVGMNYIINPRTGKVVKKMMVK